MTQAIQKTLRDSAGMRWTALLLLALAMFCAYIFMDILSPIKDLMQETRGWDSTAFGTMQGSEVFLNVFVFFLIFAGIILDKMGVRFTMLLSTVVMLVGAFIKWYAVSDSFIGQRTRDMVQQQPQLYPHLRRTRCVAVLRGNACLSQVCRLRFHGIRLWLRDGGYHRQPWYREVVQGSRDGSGHGF